MYQGKILDSPTFSRTIISKIRPWAMNLSDSSKRGVSIFSRVLIFLSKICPPHTQSQLVLSLCSVCGINDFLQLIRSRYQPTSDASMEVQVPEFSLSLLQEDIVAYFLAGKPLIYIEPSSPLRIPFKFHQSTNSVEEAE